MIPTEKIEKLTFKKAIMTIGNLPSSYVDSLSYYECLLWLCDYLENTVIPAVNNNGEAVEELQNLFISLKEYVDSYFENLDIQEEINKKLDEMSEDGELTNLISSYIEPIFNTYRSQLNSEVRQTLRSQNIQISEFIQSSTTQINEIDNKVDAVAGGSPAGTFATYADLAASSADHTKIYLVLNDGKWYYWDTTTSLWTAGGTYQSTGVGVGEVQAENLESTLANDINVVVPTLTWNTGTYRTINGVVAENPNYSCTDPIELSQNDTIYIKCNGGGDSYSIISVLTPTGEPIAINQSMSNVLNVANTTKVYSLTAKFDCHVALTYRNANSYDFIYIKKTDDNYIKDKLLNYRVPEISLNFYYYANGANVYSNNNFAYSDPIHLDANEKLVFHARGEGSAVSLMRMVGSDGTYISTILQSSGTREYDCEYTADTECYVSICSNINYLKNIYIVINEEETPYVQEAFTSFIKFGVIGDSLASGEAVANNGGSNQFIDNYTYSWGQFIARNHGMECINFSKGGATTRSFLNPINDWGVTKLLNPDNKCNAYCIGLGINDPTITNYLGTIDDIHLDDFTQNADSFYGNYGKIIGYVKQVQPKAKIFMFTMPGNYGEYLTAIRNIAELYEGLDVYLIDLNKDYYQQINSGYIGANRRVGHFNASGYNAIGELLFEAMSKYMVDNPEEFLQIEFIGTDYSYTE